MAAGPSDAAAAMAANPRASVVLADSDVEAAERRKKIANGIMRFNTKAKTGIAFFEENGLLEHTAEAHAQFLLTTEGLFKTQIGAYLGEVNKPFNQEVLRHFLASMNFVGLDLDRALRLFLSKFRLPGEAQQIDKLMESFATRFCAHNPGEYNNSDTAYILSFAIIMLNTDLHNPSVKNKMTLPQFMSTLRGIDSGKDVNPEMLERFYASIRDNEITMTLEGEPTAFDNPDRKGYLRKQGGRIKTWKKRWFVLTGNCLYYFENDKDGAAPKGILPLENLAVRAANQPKVFQFEIYHPQEKFVKAGKIESGTMKESRHEKFLLQARDENEMTEWMEAIGSQVARDPFYLLLNARRTQLEKDIADAGGGKKGANTIAERRRASTQEKRASMLDSPTGNRGSVGLDDSTDSAAANGGTPPTGRPPVLDAPAQSSPPALRPAPTVQTNHLSAAAPATDGSGRTSPSHRVITPSAAATSSARRIGGSSSSSSDSTSSSSSSDSSSSSSDGPAVAPAP